MKPGIKRYLDMQADYYEGSIEKRGMEACKDIVGRVSFEDWVCNFWKNMFFQGKRYDRALDFGCGLGRLMLVCKDCFNHVDGVDSCAGILKYAERYLNENGMPNKYSLYKCNGYDLDVLASDVYNIVYSQLVLHHICVWEIRNSYFKEFYRVLKDGGVLAIQLHGGMEFNGVIASRWYENKYDAQSTNSFFDVKLENPYYLVDDLNEIGYKNITLDFIKARPDNLRGKAKHEYTIVVRATK